MQAQHHPDQSILVYRKWVFQCSLSPVGTIAREKAVAVSFPSNAFWVFNISCKKRKKKHFLQNQTWLVCSISLKSSKFPAYILDNIFNKNRSYLLFFFLRRENHYSYSLCISICSSTNKNHLFFHLTSFLFVFSPKNRKSSSKCSEFNGSVIWDLNFIKSCSFTSSRSKQSCNITYSV